MSAREPYFDNIEKIAAIFPGCVTESRDENGRLKKAVDFKMLKQLLSEETAEGPETYGFTWAGKKAAQFKMSPAGVGQSALPRGVGTACRNDLRAY